MLASPLRKPTSPGKPGLASIVIDRADGGDRDGVARRVRSFDQDREGQPYVVGPVLTRDRRCAEPSPAECGQRIAAAADGQESRRRPRPPPHRQSARPCDRTRTCARGAAATRRLFARGLERAQDLGGEAVLIEPDVRIQGEHFREGLDRLRGVIERYMCDGELDVGLNERSARAPDPRAAGESPARADFTAPA